MLNHKHNSFGPHNGYLGNIHLSSPSPEERESGPIGLIAASMLGVVVWLVFILLYALYWSGGFSTFQNIVVFIVSACMMGLLIGLVWIILGPKRYRTWNY